MELYTDPRQSEFRNQGWLIRKVRRTPGRRTRLHTERGQLLPLQEMLRLPGNVISHLRNRGDQYPGAGTPWMNTPVVRWLDANIQPDWSILELGSGASSVWFATRAGRLLSFEHDPYWHRISAGLITDAGVTNCEVVQVDHADFESRLTALPTETFDLVVVDHLDSKLVDRSRSVELTMALVKTGGYLLLDDSDRERYRRVDRLLADWRRQRFVGLKGAPPALAVETTLFERNAHVPKPTSPRNRSR